MEYWISFIYLYGVGGILFFGVIILAINKKVLLLSRKTDRWRLGALVFAYIFYFCFQGIWNYLAITSS